MHTALGHKNDRTHMLNMTPTTARNNVKNYYVVKGSKQHSLDCVRSPARLNIIQLEKIRK